MALTETNFKRLFELSGDAMMVLDEETFIYCNPATLKIFGCSDVDLFCTKHPSDLSPQYQPCGTSSLELSKRHIQDALQQGHKRFEWVHQRLNGEEFYADVLLSQAIWQEKPVIQAIVRDISAYKALQDSLRREKEQSELATKAKSEFLAVMSHEIRTPIHGILGTQELLLNTELSEEQKTLATLAVDSTKHLLNLVNNVLDFSKIDAGKLLIEAIPFSTVDLLASVYKLYQVEAHNHGIEFLLSADVIDVRLIGDSHRIQQILANLISNAFKFTPPGGKVILESQLSLENSTPPDNSQQGSWILSVTDTGIGMTETQQKTVFDMFAQADSSTSRHFGGTGLGLSICRGLVEYMGGTITIESRQDSGSKFQVKLTLPVAPKDHLPETKSSKRLSRNYQQSVLVAEDNATNQFIIRKQLERLGITPEIVNNGQEVIDAYRASIQVDQQSRYAMILMDVQMPNINGLEATQKLRALGCQLPIVALTADVLMDRRQQCLDVGMQGFIGKPFVEAKLVEVFDMFLGSHNNEPQI